MIKPILQDNLPPRASVESLEAHLTGPAPFRSATLNVRQAKWLSPATTGRSSPPVPPRPLRINTALANVVALRTPSTHLPAKAGANHVHQKAPPTSPPRPNRSHLHDAAGGRHAAPPASPLRPNRSHLHDAVGGRHAAPPASPQLPSLSLRDGATPGEHKSARPLSPTQGLKRPRHGGATVTNQAPTRPPRPVPLQVNTGDPASLVYAQIDLASLPRYQSANGAFTSFDKTLYATLQSPAPTDTAVSRAPQERVLSWYDFGAEREKHTEFEALSARVKHLVGDKVIACKVAPPADELDKIFGHLEKPRRFYF